MDNTLINIAFEVPIWVKQGVESGTYKIFGGVVRDNMGQIVLHLKEVGLQNTRKLSKKNLPVVIGVGVTLVAVGGTYYVYKRFKSKKKQELNQQLTDIDNNINNYFASRGFANLTRDDIQNLIDSLKNVLENPSFHHIKMDKQYYDKIIEFSKCVNQNTCNLALFKKEQVQLPDPRNESTLIEILNIIITSLNKQKQLLFES